MKKLIYTLGLVMITSMIFWSCQNDELLNPEEGDLLKGGKIKTTSTEVTFTRTEACANEAVTFTLTGDGQKQIRMWDGDEWIQLASAGNNSDPLTYTTVLAAGTYYFGYKIGNDFYPSPSAAPTAGTEVIITSCCDDANFSYITEDNLNIVFSYNHSEEAELTIAFTFPQVINCELNSENKYVATDSKIYAVNNPENQTVFTWTGVVGCNASEPETFSFAHAADCGPSTAKDGEAIIWTDAKIVAINGTPLVDNPETTENEGPVSLKGTLSNIVYTQCPISNKKP